MMDGVRILPVRARASTARETCKPPRRITGSGATFALIAVAALGFATSTGASAGEGSDAAHERGTSSPLSPGTVEYTWHLRVPEWEVRPRHAGARILAPAWRVRRFDYSVPGFRTERRRVGSVAAFECKYNDFGLPNACRTTWRGVYVDVPHPVARHDYVDLDVPTLAWQHWDASVETPELRWKDETLTISLPAPASGPSAARD